MEIPAAIFCPRYIDTNKRSYLYSYHHCNGNVDNILSKTFIIASMSEDSQTSVAVNWRLMNWISFSSAHCVPHLVCHRTALSPFSIFCLTLRLRKQDPCPTSGLLIQHIGSHMWHYTHLVRPLYDATLSRHRNWESLKVAANFSNVQSQSRIQKCRFNQISVKEPVTI